MPHDSKGQYYAFPHTIDLSVNDFRIVDANGDVGNLVANGGGFASDSAPVLRGNAAESQELSWIASNSTAIACHTGLPANFSGADDVTIELEVNSGTTDAATFTCETGWDSGTLVSDTVTDGSKSATTHTISSPIAAADIPDAARNLTVILTPAAHTTNAIQLLGVRLLYVPRTLAP